MWDRRASENIWGKKNKHGENVKCLIHIHEHRVDVIYLPFNRKSLLKFTCLQIDTLQSSGRTDSWPRRALFHSSQICLFLEAQDLPTAVHFQADKKQLHLLKLRKS